jgi:RND family efflux transporter MFP subunit
MPTLGSARWRIARAIALLFALTVVSLSFTDARALAGPGGPGHDHGPPAKETGAAASPRVVAVSEGYQLVGIVEGEVLVIYLDRAADNAPVTSATLEVSLDGTPHKAELQKNATYEITSPRLKKPGSIEVLISLADGSTTDLLVGALVIPGRPNGERVASGGLISAIRRAIGSGEGAGSAHAAGGSTNWPSSRWIALSAGSMLLAGLAAGLAFAQRKRLVVAVVGIGVLLLAASAALAHEGHDHGPDQSASPGNSPARRPDGSIFLPKPSQRLLEVRTRIVETQSARRAVRLAGRVVTNPNFSGIVQSTIQGRYQAPAGGVPPLGTAVRAGDLLGSVNPSFASIDASDMAQTLGDLEQKISLARAKLARQEQLLRTNVVARAAVDETRLELDGLVKRRSQLLEARVRPEELRAPVDGVIAVVKVVSGQVVTQSDRIFQIIDPGKLLVEALVYDQVNPDAVLDAKALIGQHTEVRLEFMGRSRALQQQYSLLQFRVVDDNAALNVGAPVTVLASVGSPVEGIFVPRAALAQAPNGQMVVFLHKEPELFLPRQVRTEPFDAQTVVVTGGLEPGDKIVVRNAPLVNQVR